MGAIGTRNLFCTKYSGEIINSNKIREPEKRGVPRHLLAEVDFIAQDFVTMCAIGYPKGGEVGWFVVYGHQTVTMQTSTKKKDSIE
ncbi:hypothetical protein L6452_16623 [Arctium lappa]|uniref:Uncharacterized protein n=1 Tax=Arctium lappa TaxID=4217 RepID=A0ACB9C1C2_ARCLA|nr:hypothetical protein L6452_16623 [Arctium lappa]